VSDDVDFSLEGMEKVWQHLLLAAAEDGVWLQARRSVVRGHRPSAWHAYTEFPQMTIAVRREQFRGAFP